MNSETLKILLFQMRRIRHVEQEIARRYSEGNMRCPTHLSVGQEAVAAGVGFALQPTDMAVSGHRAHAHYLAKGGSLPAMVAEIYGKVGGCSRGKGGSMHLIDESVGFMGSTAIVAGSIPVGVGLALGMKHSRSNQVSCIFHGDAAVESGVFFESINFATVKKLPVLFICENNFYSVYSPLGVRQPEGRSISKMASGLGISVGGGDGTDVKSVNQLAERAVASIRAGEGPWLLEFSTYRWLEHCGPNVDDHLGYRPEDERNKWIAKDPIASLELSMISTGVVTTDEIAQMDRTIRREVDIAFEFAAVSPFPKAEDAYSDLYDITTDPVLYH